MGQFGWHRADRPDCPTPKPCETGCSPPRSPRRSRHRALSRRHPRQRRKRLRSLARHLDQRRDTGRNGTAIRLDEICEIAGVTRVRFLHVLSVTLIFGAVVGLSSGLVAAFSSGLVSGRFFLAVLLFEVTTDFPDHPAAFLDRARRNGLLGTATRSDIALLGVGAAACRVAGSAPCRMERQLATEKGQ